jgi:hypothetical protein
VYILVSVCISFKAARLQIHVYFHENFRNVFKNTILLDEQIEQYTYCNQHLQPEITKMWSTYYTKQPLLR